MIYILSGNDIKNRNVYLKKLYKNNLPIFISQADLVKEKLFDYARSVSLFGELPIIVVDNLIKDGNITFSEEDLILLKESPTTFVFLEDKLLASSVKEYKKYASMEDFSKKDIKQIPKINIFNIADAFSRKDKINTWVLYREAISSGISPEEISGVLFWKIKTMILNGNKFFTTKELKDSSSELVSIYHRAHMGEFDFTIGLEQFILSALTKK